MVLWDVVDAWSEPERVTLATGVLAGLSVAARLQATSDALAVLGSDETVRAVRRAEAEQILTDAEPAVTEHWRR